MLSEERRQKILALTAERGRIRIAELVETFGVSKVTIHRDLERLVNEGMVRKMHGGVAHVGVQEQSYRERIIQQHSEKQAIARAALELIQPGTTIFLSPGTTTTEIARILPRTGIIVVTNSLPISNELMQTTELEVVLTGGSIRRHAEALVGTPAEVSLGSMFINLAFIGVTGMDEQGGLTVYSEGETRVLQQVLRSSRKSVVVADSSKWGKIVGTSIAPLSNIHALITDSHIPKEAVKHFATLDVEVIQAEGKR